MKKAYLILLALLVVALAALLPGCSSNVDELEGKYVVTFELNGGILDLKSTNVSTNINYAYEPGSFIVDPTCAEWNYKLTRAGYTFTGWYTSENCAAGEKWDFATGKITTEKLTLYAGWEKEIVYTYSVCYVDGGNTQVLGEYKVKAGDKFEDYRKYADKREGYTAIGYFADPECTTAWDFTTVHPGGDVDTDVKVYVGFITGEWKIVDSYQSLKNAIGTGNIYLTCDIDCEGKELSFGDFNHVFEGNGFKISNFTVKKSGGALMPSVSLFQSLNAGAEIRNVSFENVNFQLFGIEKATKIKVAALAKDGKDCIISNVSITGTLHTDYTGEFPSLEEAFYEETSGTQVSGFTAEITVSVEKES